MNESKPYMTPQGYVDPTSKYYIDRMWEEYHKLKEELADTKTKLAQSEDYINETLKLELAETKSKLRMAQSAWDELDKSHAERAKLHDELVIAEGQRDQWKMRWENLCIGGIMEKRDRFMLEQKLMNCWQMTDDLDTIAEYVGDSDDISPQGKDRLLNLLIGTRELYQLKFEHTLDLFNELIRNGDIT